MLTQYPWVSVKNQERKHIEIGAMVTLLAAIISFYSIPDFGNGVIIEKPYLPHEVEIINIPATVQPPEIAEPLRPTLPIESENEDIDVDVETIIFGDTEFAYLEAAPPIYIPTIPFWKAEVKPEPIGGNQAIMRNVVYPRIAIEARQEGRVTVEALIGIDGIVKEVTVLKGMPGTGLDEAAMAAVFKTPFSPAYQRDKPVQVKMSIPIIFRLK